MIPLLLDERDGKRDPRQAFEGHLLYIRAARIGPSHGARYFVQALSSGIIKGLTHDVVLPHSFDDGHKAMAP
jgi:hypothetical protein